MRRSQIPNEHQKQPEVLLNDCVYHCCCWTVNNTEHSRESIERPLMLQSSSRAVWIPTLLLPNSITQPTHDNLNRNDDNDNHTTLHFYPKIDSSHSSWSWRYWHEPLTPVGVHHPLGRPRLFRSHRRHRHRHHHYYYEHQNTNTDICWVVIICCHVPTVSHHGLV